MQDFAPANELSGKIMSQAREERSRTGTKSTSHHLSRSALARQLDEVARRPNAPPPISDHTLLQRIGSGAYGDVWLARNALGTFRAVKIVYRGRFEEEHPYEREF